MDKTPLRLLATARIRREPRHGHYTPPTGLSVPIVTVLDVDHLWVQADVEESYIDRVGLNQHIKIQLPSGNILDGTVMFKGVESDFATQRDVSRTKRDIKTFEVRLRVDNRDRRLAVGMTAYVLLPVR